MSTGIYPALISSTGGGSGIVTIPEFTSDPVSPSPNETWVLYTSGGNAGQPIGLLLALTYAGSGGSSSYQLSYETTEGTIVRTPLPPTSVVPTVVPVDFVFYSYYGGV